MVTTVGPQDVLDAVRVAREALSSVAEPSGVRGSREEWAAVAGELQSLVNVATAVQDAAIVRLAAVEPEWCEDGTLVEVHQPLGHGALDAPAVVSGVLNLTAVAAERRVRHALRTAADGPEGTDASTGLGGLHAAMASGRLDAYRAQVVAAELEECPPEVASTVVASLEGWFGVEDSARLRRRARRLLARISPDLLRQRAQRARSESSLRRWVEEPGVDTWLGTFPSEEACRAWAAIDELAQRYLADGTCERVDRARAKALTDLVTGQATVDVQVVLTVPAATAGPDDGLVEVAAPGTAEPVLVDRGWLAQAGRARVAACDPVTGALVDVGESLATGAYRPGKSLAALVRARDGRCRFPGCHVAARFCDLDHVTPWPTGPTTATNLACLCRRHHRVKQRPGWTATLHANGSITWTDPTGRTRVTHPVDHLHRLELPAAPPRARPGTPGDPLPHPPRRTPQHPRTPPRTPPRRPPTPPHLPHRHPRPHATTPHRHPPHPAPATPAPMARAHRRPTLLTGLARQPFDEATLPLRRHLPSQAQGCPHAEPPRQPIRGPRPAPGSLRPIRPRLRCPARRVLRRRCGPRTGPPRHRGR